MNTRLAFEDYTALHHRLETLPAVDERGEGDERQERTEKPQLAFENRPARETIKEEAPRLAKEDAPRSLREEAGRTIREDAPRMVREEAPRLAMETRQQRQLVREVAKEPEEKVPGMWRSILQLRVLLPYVSKLLPLLESGLTGGSAIAHAQSTAAQNSALQAVEKTALDIHSSHKELRIQLQDQAIEFKRVEEQLERLREATERNTLEQQELIEDLKSFAGTIKVVGWAAVALLAGVLGTVGYVAFHLKH
jgi:hypothetical protein